MRERTTSRREVISGIEREIARMRHYSIQKNPYFPDLLNQPDFLVVPEMGRLIALFVYTPHQRLSWRSTLAIAEDLFEIKLATGESTLTAGLLFSSFPISHNESVYLDLLNNLFDVFAVDDQNGETQARSWVVGRMTEAEPKADLFQLWRLERERVTRNVVRFDEQKYIEFVDERMRSETTKAALIREMEDTLMTEPGIEAIEQFPVRSPKEALAGLPERNVFRFDFGLRAPRPEGRTKVVDVAVLDRYGSREKIRYLMTKARFVSYDFADARLFYRGDGVSPVLMIAGNVAGPSHDPYRYVKALVSVGWELEHAYPEALRKVIHADI
jgi:hypothetical protein